jgi:hypothetical protein
MVDTILQIINATKELIALIFLVIGYLRERNKRERFEKAYVELDDKYQVLQQSFHTLNTTMTQAVTINQQLSLNPKDVEKMDRLSELLTFAQATTQSTLAMAPPAIHLEAASNEARLRLLKKMKKENKIEKK